MNGDHDLCKIHEEVAVLNQRSVDEAKALILAKDVASARWIAIIALLGVLIDSALLILKVVKP